MHHPFIRCLSAEAGVLPFAYSLHYSLTRSIHVSRVASVTHQTMLKRAFDIVLALPLLIVLAPSFVVIAAFVRLDSPGPVFHRARRAGRGGQPFTLYKFRTMVVNAANVGPGITRGNDPRVTRVGRVLRRTKIDELPQLVNVLKGEMSMVGPRPEDPRYVVNYTPEQRRLLSVRPGIASPASIKYRHEEEILAAAGGDLDEAYRTTILPDKLRIDLEYVGRQSLLLDLAVLVRVAVSLFSPSCLPPS